MPSLGFCSPLPVRPLQRRTAAAVLAVAPRQKRYPRAGVAIVLCATPPERAIRGDDGTFGNTCVTSVGSAEQLQQFIGGDAAGDTIHVDERGRLRYSKRLVILSVTRADSLACGLVRPVLSRSCVIHRHETLFLEMCTDNAWATAEAHKLGVRRLPTVIMFRNGKRVDHFSGRDVKADIEQLIRDNL
jgi:hypothetical protein